jgi:hypothetical protein
VKANKDLRKVIGYYRSEFKGKPEVQATLALGKDDFDKFPVLKERGFAFVEVMRLRTNKLQVLFV